MALRYTLTFVNIPKNQEENPIFDSLSAYINSIASASKLVVNDVSPFDLALSTSCKIQLTDNTSFISKQLVYNYCRVTKYSTTPELSYTYYFWVKRNTRLSNNVIQFDMEMDTLNTFKSSIETSCQTLKNHITRCHIDRYSKNNNILIPIIDDIDEGFGLVQYEESKQKIEYRYTVGGIPTFPFSDRNIYMLINTEQNNYKSNVHAAKTITYYDPITEEQKTISLEAIDQSIPSVRVSIGMVLDKSFDVVDQTDRYLDWNVLQYAAKIDDITSEDYRPYAILNSYIDHTIDSFDNIDKSLSTTLKIKDVPYPPMPMNIINNGDTLSIDEAYSRGLGIGLMYFPNPANGLKMEMGEYTNWGRYLELAKTDKLIPFDKYLLNTNDIYLDLPNLIGNINVDATRTYNDPKIYNSSFYTLKYFYYDTAYNVKLENMNFTESYLRLNVYYQVTTELSLDFMFQISPESGFKHKESDFEGYMIVSSAPEESLFSSEYLNYMRNGYGYDRQQHTHKLTNSIISLTSSSIRQVSNMAESAMEEDYAGAAASAIDLIGGFVKFASSEVLWQDKMNRQRVKLSQQSPQISDTKNGKLIQEITGNRIYLSRYKPKQSEIAKLNKLFHYYGYLRELDGQMPYDTRYWFNFIQGDIHLERRVPEYAIPDVKARFKAGVTFYHYHNSTYDFEQEKENWEVSLL